MFSILPAAVTAPTTTLSILDVDNCGCQLPRKGGMPHTNRGKKTGSICRHYLWTTPQKLLITIFNLHVRE